MHCSHCKKRKATIHILELVEGRYVASDLCETCAFGQEGAVYPGKIQIVGKIVAHVEPGRKGAGAATRTCPGCGMSLERFLELRRLGCARCYRTFRREVEQIFESVHEEKTHHGKVPERPQSAPPSPMQLRRLQEKLARAIDEERFEEAALYRDEIRRLQELMEKENEAG